MGVTAAHWESLCDGCGICCCLPPEKLFACPALDCATRQCKSYNTRLVDYMCVKVTPENTMALHRGGTLPDTCGYVRHMKKFGPIAVPPAPTPRPFEEAPSYIKKIYWRMSKLWFS